MGADRIAAIRPLIAELEDASRDDPGAEHCAEFTIGGRDDLWVQVVRGTINLAYPYAEHPVETLHRLGIDGLPGMRLAEWKADQFATLLHDDRASAGEVARFIDRIFRILLGCLENDSIDAGMVRL